MTDIQVEIPLIFCNLTEVINDALHCMDEGLGAVGCLAFPNGEFRCRSHVPELPLAMVLVLRFPAEFVSSIYHSIFVP